MRRTSVGRGESASAAVHISVVAVISLGLATGLSAQSSPPLEPDDRVRVRVTPSRSADRGYRQEFRGSVIRSEGDTLVLSVHSAVGPVAIPVSWIESLEVSRGTESARSAAWRSGQAGLLVGAVIGSTVGAELAAMGEESFLRAVPLRAIIYGLSAGLPAALLGALNPGERWERVPIRVFATTVSASDELSFGLEMVTRW